MLRALVDHLVAPAHDVQAAVPAPRPGGPSASMVALLCAPGHARALGTALGARLARRARCAAAVAVWGVPTVADRGGLFPARHDARRLADALTARDIAARPVGRAVLVSLPDGEPEALLTLERVEAVAAAAPVALVLSAARGPALDGRLEGCDVVLVADDGPAGALAVAALGRRGIAARPLGLASAPSAVAAPGGALLPSARRRLHAALEGGA